MQRVVLLVLVVVALLCAVALGAGAYLGEMDEDEIPPDMSGSRALQLLERIGMKDPLGAFTARGIGDADACSNDGANVTIAPGAGCLLEFPATEEKSVRMGTLRRVSPVNVCFALSESQLEKECADIADGKYLMRKPEARLTVPSGGAFAKVLCAGLGASACVVSVR